MARDTTAVLLPPSQPLQTLTGQAARCAGRNRLHGGAYSVVVIVVVNCVDDFANILDLKGQLSLMPWVHRNELADALFECVAGSTELNDVACP
jgi:hypothetical protein